MPRRLLVLLLATLAVTALTASNAGATKFNTTYWDVSIDGKQTVKWSFAAERSLVSGGRSSVERDVGSSPLICRVPW